MAKTPGRQASFKVAPVLRRHGRVVVAPRLRERELDGNRRVGGGRRRVVVAPPLRVLALRRRHRSTADVDEGDYSPPGGSDKRRRNHLLPLLKNSFIHRWRDCGNKRVRLPQV